VGDALELVLDWTDRHDILVGAIIIAARVGIGVLEHLCRLRLHGQRLPRLGTDRLAVPKQLRRLAWIGFLAAVI
jgi:hypothetical protein